jgi:hypothetical protein
VVTPCFPAVIGLAPAITQGLNTLELQIVFGTGVHVELSGLVSNCTVAEVKPVVVNETAHERHGRLALELGWPACVPVPVKWYVKLQSYGVCVDCA